MFTSRKLEQDLKPREMKPPIVNQKCVVYSFTCDLCDSDYVGFTARHLHQRIVEHTPFAVHLRKIYIHLRQQLKLYGKYTFISTSMNFINANELSITLFAYVLTFNSING